MKKYWLLTAGFIVLTTIGSFAQSRQKTKSPVPVILDTDISPDYDDVGAMAVLHALADAGEARPLAVMSSNKNELVAPVISVLNTYFGRPDLPIGAPKGADACDYKAVQEWPELLVQKYPHKIKSTSEAPDAVTLYRKILAREPDHSVTIVSIGFLTNLAHLLQSPPDQYSRLEGRALVAKKVKQLVSMAGKFPEGREYNLFIDSVASQNVFLHWPTPVIYSGFEIGLKVITGKQLSENEVVKNSPVKDAYVKAMPYWKSDRNGRHSWDQTAVLVAIKGTAPYYSLQQGKIVINGGNNAWKNDPTGKQAYLVEALPVEKVRAEIEGLMMHQPVSEK